MYDTMRAAKDMKVNLSYGKIEVRKETGQCEIDFFVGRTASQDLERRLCARLKRAVDRPLEVRWTGRPVPSPPPAAASIQPASPQRFLSPPAAAPYPLRPSPLLRRPRPAPRRCR